MKIRQLIRFGLPLIIYGLLISSCEKDQGPVIVKPPPLPGDTMIHFESDIQAIFNAHCISCHNQNHIYLDLRESFAWYNLWVHGTHAPYLNVADPENSILMQRLRGVELSIMPPNAAPLPSSTIDTIAKWMRQGGLDN
jgi:hypothetical protein